MKRKQKTSAFTLIEVMVAIGIVTVGSVGLLAMQQAAFRANRSSREITNATNISQVWIERLERDAQTWTTSGAAGVSNTEYLVTLMALEDTTGWFVPTASSTGSYAFDWDGNDTTDESQFRYCTHLQLSWLRPGSSIRVDVRTFYVREGIYESEEAVSGNYLEVSDCVATDAATVDLSIIPNISSVVTSTIVKWNSR